MPHFMYIVGSIIIQLFIQLYAAQQIHLVIMLIYVIDLIVSQVIVQGYPQHVFGLAVYGDFLYWTDWLLRAVLRANKFTGSDITYLKKSIMRQPMGIVAVAEDSNNCMLFSCSSLYLFYSVSSISCDNYKFREQTCIDMLTY